MRGGFRPLVNPGCRVSEVDLDATREARAAVAEDFRQREFISWLVVTVPVGVGGLSVASMDIEAVPEPSALDHPEDDHPGDDVSEISGVGGSEALGGLAA